MAPARGALDEAELAADKVSNSDAPTLLPRDVAAYRILTDAGERGQRARLDPRNGSGELSSQLSAMYRLWPRGAFRAT